MTETEGEMSAEEIAENLYGTIFETPTRAEDIQNIAAAIREAEDRGRKSVQPPSEWADLQGLEGKELRERLRCRSHMWRRTALMLEAFTPTGTDKPDTQILIDLIYAKELAVTQEAERMWEAHLDSFEHYLGQPGGTGRIVAELGHEYLPVIVDRAAGKRARAAADKVEEAYNAGKATVRDVMKANGKALFRRATEAMSREEADNHVPEIQEVS